MTRPLLVLILYVLAVDGYLLGQTNTFKYGDISQEYLEKNSFSIDSTASAIFLLRKGRAQLRGSDFKMVVDMHVRIKILNKQGFKYATQLFYYHQGETDIKNFRGATYSLDNKAIKMSEVGKGGIFKEDEGGGTKVLKVIFPNVQEGSIIEYTYKQVVGDVYNLPSWNYQMEIPVLLSDYKIEIPKYGDYQPNFQGLISPTLIENEVGFFHVAMENLPALEEESYVASLENYRSKISFEVKSITIPGYGRDVYMQDWDQINSQLLSSELFGKVYKRKSRIKDLYPFEKGWKNNLESLQEIYSYTRNHFRWNGENEYLVDDSVNNIWEKKECDNAEINFLLLQFLLNAGIEAYPVISSTRTNGFINEKTPLLNQFDYMLVCAKIGEDKILLDATNKFSPYNVLQPRIINGKGLLISDKGPEWIELDINNEVDRRNASFELLVTEDLFLRGSAKIILESNAAASIRDELSRSENLIDDYASNLLVGEVADLTIVDAEDVSKPFQLSYNFELEDEPIRIGDEIIIRPILLKKWKNNPFPNKQRYYPVDFPIKQSYTLAFNVKVPDNYEIKEVPKSRAISLPDKGGRYLFQR